MNALGAQMKYGGLTLIGLAILALLLLWPAWRRAAEVSLEMHEVRGHLERLQGEVASGEAVDARLAILQERQRTALKPIPARADPHGLMQSIIVGLESLPLRESNLSRGSRSVQADTQSLGLKIETSGNFEDVYRLVRHVESLPRLVVIRDLAMAHEPTLAGNGMVKATISLDAFYEVDDETGAAIAAAGVASPASGAGEGR